MGQKQKVAETILPGGRWLGAFQQETNGLGHFTKGQMGGGHSPRGRQLGAPCQGADGWENFTRGQIAWIILPGDR